MKIFNFGPTSLDSPDSFKYAASLVKEQEGEALLIFTSAIVGTSTSLEGIVVAHQKGELEKAMEILNGLRKKYYDISCVLLGEQHAIHDELNDHFVTIEWDLEDPPHEDYDFAYDQIVSVGILLSSQLMAAYLSEVNPSTHWLDVRDIVLANDDFRKGIIEIKETSSKAQKHLGNLSSGNKIVVTQAALGTTTENYSITLNPEEDSSYSAAVIGHALGSVELYSWVQALSAESNLTENVIAIDKAV